jgi:mannonate dehydratase
MMQQTMRWFGPEDKVTLSNIRQAGCSGVVSALHNIPNGEIWPIEQILQRKYEIQDAGMDWSVVESLPVHESIKTQSGNFDELIDNYISSLENLASCGINIVTYNFMPLLDWTRTNLQFQMPDGAVALKFELDAVAVFDLFILKRPEAKNSYDAETLMRATLYFESMTSAEKELLERNIIKGLPGSEESFTAKEFLAEIERYNGISSSKLKDNLCYFLNRVCPVADKLNIKLVIHPDDPPFSLFGLPRVVSTKEDLSELFNRIPNPSNGLCFCAGSFSIRADNNLTQIIKLFAERINFIHLRNTQRGDNGDFFESQHLHGSIDMYSVVRSIVEISAARGVSIPMRPDHGHQILDDLGKVTNPGYSAIGRLKGLAELRGLELGIVRAMN